jgi:hypothetical protein
VCGPGAQCRAWPCTTLDFDYSEDDDGNGTWDAMASVTPTHLSALLAEVAEVLRWAHRDFGGRPAPLDEGGDWDWALHSLHEKGAAPCALHYDAASASVVLTPRQPPARATDADAHTVRHGSLWPGAAGALRGLTLFAALSRARQHTRSSNGKPLATSREAAAINHAPTASHKETVACRFCS